MMACSIGWRPLFAALYDRNCLLRSRNTSNSILMQTVKKKTPDYLHIIKTGSITNLYWVA